MIYVSQITMLYTLNSYSAVGQLYLYKTGRKKKMLKGICSFTDKSNSNFLITHFKGKYK